MRSLLDCVNLDIDGDYPKDDSEYVLVDRPRISKKLKKKPSNDYLRQIKATRSMNDLSSYYSNDSTISLQSTSQASQKSSDGRTSSESLPIPPSLNSFQNSRARQLREIAALQDMCRKFVEEKVIEQQKQRKFAVPQSRYVYGDPQASEVIPDKSLEVYGDFHVCALSEKEIVASKAEKEKWIEDRVRGVHYPSLLNVRRAQLSKAMNAALEANTRIVAKPLRSIQTVQMSAEKCKNCAIPESIVPLGLNPTDWLPIFNLRRAERCERQRPISEQSVEPYTIIISRMLQKNAPHFSVPISEKSYHRHPGPSPLSKAINPFNILARYSGIVVDEDMLNSLLNDVESEFAVQQSFDDSNSISDTSSDYFNSLLNDVEGEFEVQQSGDDSNSMSDTSSDYFNDTIDDDVETDCTSEYSGPISAASVITEAVEVRELQWVKKYRVPKFLTTDEDRHRSLLPVISSTEAIVESVNEVKVLKLNFNKPLPALPVSTPSQSSFTNSQTSSRSLRRSQSAHLDMLGSQRLEHSQLRPRPLYKETTRSFDME